MMQLSIEALIAAAAIFLALLTMSLWRRCSALEALLMELQSLKKSSEVRSGKLAETLAPLTGEFPVDIKKRGTATVFLGQPIDYVHFDPEEGVTFIEVKSETSDLSTSQRKIRDLVNEGRVFWSEMRMSGASQGAVKKKRSL